MTPITGGPTSATLEGPSSGTEGVASSLFTIRLDQPAQTGGVSCVITDSGSGDTITSTPVVIAENHTTGTFRITAGTTGNRTITLYSATASGPQSLDVTGQQITYNAVAAGVATSYTFTGPLTVPNGEASALFTLTPTTDPSLDVNNIYTNAGSSTATIRVLDSRGGYVDHTFTGATPITFSVTATNLTQFTLTPTCQGSPPPYTDPAPITVTPLTLITMDSTWFSGKSEPYVLDTSDRYYRLDQDVTTNLQAFTIDGSGITFDLNTHTITYDNASPIGVPDGGFEYDSIGTTAANMTYWDCSNAPAAIIAAVRLGMWGSNMLHLPNITTQQIINSSPINIPTANIPYAATITPKCNSINTEVNLAVIDIDASPNVSLGNFSHDQPDSGYSPVVIFTPTSTHRVILRVTVTPASGGDTVDLDYADLMRANVYGVANGAVAHCPYFTLMNGAITQGQGNSYNTPAVLYHVDESVSPTTYGTFDNLNIYAYGMDTNIMDHQWAHNIRITNSIITANHNHISSRKLLFGAITINRATGYMDIRNNTITGPMECGIVVIRTVVDTSGVTINNNIITHTSICTEGYGIASNNYLYNFEIAYNSIIPVDNGRGLLLDNIANNGTVHDNYMESREHPNLEYTSAGLEATTLRVRPQLSGPAFPIQDVTFTNNTFAAYRVADGAWAAMGMGIQCFTSDSNVVFINNLFKGIVLDLYPNLGGLRETKAWGCTLAMIDAGTGLRFEGNTFESNSVSLNFGDPDGWNGLNSGVLFINNTFRKNDTEGITMTYHPITVGDWMMQAENIWFIDNEYTNGATNTFLFPDNTATKGIAFGYLLTVTVTYQSNPVSGATVTITDSSSGNSSGGPYTTGPDGTVQVPGCVETYTSDGTTTQNNTPVHVVFTSLVVSATSGGFSGATSPFLPTGDQSITIPIS